MIKDFLLMTAMTISISCASEESSTLNNTTTSVPSESVVSTQDGTLDGHLETTEGLKDCDQTFEDTTIYSALSQDGSRVVGHFRLSTDGEIIWLDKIEDSQTDEAKKD